MDFKLFTWYYVPGTDIWRFYLSKRFLIACYGDRAVYRQINPGVRYQSIEYDTNRSDRDISDFVKDAYVVERPKYRPLASNLVELFSIIFD